MNKRNQNKKPVEKQEIYDPNQEYEVERITDMRTFQKQNKITKKFELITEFLVKWVGYEQLTWEPLENLDNCKELLNDFLKKQEKISNNQLNNNKKEREIKKCQRKSQNTYSKRRSANSIINNRNKSKVKSTKISTYELIGNLNNRNTHNDCTSNLNNQKKLNKNVEKKSEQNNTNVNSFSNKDNKEYNNKEKLKNNIKDKGNDNGANNNKMNYNNNVETIGTKIVINNSDFSEPSKMNGKENLNNIDNEIISYNQFMNCASPSDNEDKMRFDQISNGIGEENHEFLGKKRIQEKGDKSNDKKNKIIVKEINSMLIPEKITDKFLINSINKIGRKYLWSLYIKLLLLFFKIKITF